MLYLLLGSDEFSKKEFIKELAKKNKGELVWLSQEADIPEIDYFTQATLFGGQKIFVLRGLFSKLDLENQPQALKQSPHAIVLLEESLDKRKKATTKLLSDKEIISKEFVSPEGPALLSWVTARAKALGGNIEKNAAQVLINRLVSEKGPSGFGPGEADLWRLDNELRKLLSYADQSTITQAMVENLVPKDTETGVFEIINAAAEKQSKATTELLSNFLKTTEGTDEKSKIIQLNAILSDQLRNLLLYKAFAEEKVADTKILKQTGWKSGRLYVMKKLSGKFETKKLLSLLSKLESLDGELKTSSTPPRVLLDLIVTQLLV